MKTRFDLEQEIMQCWSVVEDLDLLLEECEKITDAEVCDHIQNIVLGLRSVSEMRFQNMFNTFEDLIRFQKI
jgi:hypothetical protein